MTKLKLALVSLLLLVCVELKAGWELTPIYQFDIYGNRWQVGTAYVFVKRQNTYYQRYIPQNYRFQGRVYVRDQFGGIVYARLGPNIFDGR